MIPRGKNFGDNLDLSESGNWNVASDFSRIKIMKLLSELDDYEIVCEFGALDILEDFQISDEIKKLARIKALYRYAKTLRMLIGNTVFAVKKEDTDKMNKWKKETNDLRKVIPSCEKITINQRDKKRDVNIDESKFNFILDKLIFIKEELLYPLNKAELIYMFKEEFDPKKFKQQLKEDISEGG